MSTLDQNGEVRSHASLGTPVIWGVNFGEGNITAAYLETVAICEAFKSKVVESNGITLEAIEIGKEADLYPLNGHRDSNYTLENYLPEYVPVSLRPMH